MTFPVLIQSTDGRFTATLVGDPNVRATASSRAASELGKQVIALLGPLGGSGMVTAGLGNHGEGLVVQWQLAHDLQFLVDGKAAQGMLFRAIEIAKPELNLRQLYQRHGLIGLVAEGLPDPQAFLRREASFLEVPPGSGLVA